MRFAIISKPTDIYGTVRIPNGVSWKLTLQKFGSTATLATVGDGVMVDAPHTGATVRRDIVRHSGSVVRS